jgi:N-acetylmuramoyl-L-alanine amidase
MRLNRTPHVLLMFVAAIVAAVAGHSAAQSEGAAEATSVERLPADAATDNSSELKACRADFRVVLDVGHSEKASGAMSARGKTEYEFNKLLVDTIRIELEKRGYSKINVIVSGGGPGSLGRRAEQANKLAANLFLSIHHDSVQPQYMEWWIFEGKKRQYSDRFAGFSIFVSKLNKGWESSFRFGGILADKLMQRELAFSLHHEEAIPGEGRTLLDHTKGIYQYDNLVVLKLSKAPAVLLEAGVIVNRDEERELSSAARRHLIAAAVTEAVDAFCVEGTAPKE